MIYILLINILTIIIGVIIYNKKNKKIAGLNQFNNFLREQNKELNNVIKTNEKKQKNIDMSNSNFTKALSYKALNSGKRYTSISKLNDGQEIVIIFDEKDISCSIEYYDKTVGCKIEDYIEALNFECTTFIDGEIFDPILLSRFYKGNKKIEIDPIDCGKYKQRGLGTCVIQSLVNVLNNYGIEELIAKLSTVDYCNKDDLYNFYLNKNGFDLVSELTENSWGLVVKKINKDNPNKDEK